MKRQPEECLRRLVVFPFKIQIGQHLTRQDNKSRVVYCASVLAMVYEQPLFFSNVWFTDECHIHLNGFNNRQTNRFLGFERPDIIVEKLIFIVTV